MAGFCVCVCVEYHKVHILISQPIFNIPCQGTRYAWYALIHVHQSVISGLQFWVWVVTLPPPPSPGPLPYAYSNLNPGQSHKFNFTGKLLSSTMKKNISVRKLDVAIIPELRTKTTYFLRLNMFAYCKKLVPSWTK